MKYRKLGNTGVIVSELGRPALMRGNAAFTCDTIVRVEKFPFLMTVKRAPAMPFSLTRLVCGVYPS